MTFPDHIWKQLKSITADELVRALERDHWDCDATAGSQCIYRHPDGRRVSIHYHPGKTYGPKLLQSLLEDIGWTILGLRRLKLVK